MSHGPLVDLEQAQVQKILNIYDDRLKQVNTRDATLKALTMLAINDASLKKKQENILKSKSSESGLKKKQSER